MASKRKLAGHRSKPVARKAKKKAAAAPTINLPADLCSPSAVTAGFGMFEPIVNHASTLLTAGDQPALPKALAADSISHLVEGWRYFSSAIYSFLAHANGLSIHHAYYAELRAAFSLFAASGVSVRKPNHEYLDHRGSTKIPSWSKRPTHKLAWELWKDWSRSTFADKLFSDELKILPSVSISDLQQVIQSVSTVASLNAWGFDFVTLQDDHEARNEASYEPYWSKKPLTSMASDDFRFVVELWQQIQPTVAGLQFERSLIHYLIDNQLLEEQTADPAFDERAWYDNLEASLNKKTGTPIGELKDVLELRPYPARPFIYANEGHKNARNVLSRALFLLRLATLATNNNFTIQPRSSGKLWIRNWLIHAGLWNHQIVLSPDDIWADFDEIATTAPPVNPLPYHIFNENPPTDLLARLTRPDAVLAWSLAL